jgi:hypothetical protein
MSNGKVTDSMSGGALPNHVSLSLRSRLRAGPIGAKEEYMSGLGGPVPPSFFLTFGLKKLKTQTFLNSNYGYTSKNKR